MSDPIELIGVSIDGRVNVECAAFREVWIALTGVSTPVGDVPRGAAIGYSVVPEYLRVGTLLDSPTRVWMVPVVRCGFVRGFTYWAYSHDQARAFKTVWI